MSSSQSSGTPAPRTPGTAARQQPGPAPRTLAEELRARSDEGLAALLRARPDLLHPVPSDLTQLSTRLSTRASVVRALERLDRFTLQTAEALAIAPDICPHDTLRDLLTGNTARHTDPEQKALARAVVKALPAALATLRAQALVWGADDSCAWSAPPGTCSRPPTAPPGRPASARPSPRPRRAPSCPPDGCRRSCSTRGCRPRTTRSAPSPHWPPGSPTRTGPTRCWPRARPGSRTCCGD